MKGTRTARVGIGRVHHRYQRRFKAAGVRVHRREWWLDQAWPSEPAKAEAVRAAGGTKSDVVGSLTETKRSRGNRSALLDAVAEVIGSVDQLPHDLSARKKIDADFLVGAPQWARWLSLRGRRPSLAMTAILDYLRGRLI